MTMMSVVIFSAAALVVVVLGLWEPGVGMLAGVAVIVVCAGALSSGIDPTAMFMAGTGIGLAAFMNGGLVRAKRKRREYVDLLAKIVVPNLIDDARPEPSEADAVRVALQVPGEAVTFVGYVRNRDTVGDERDFPSLDCAVTAATAAAAVLDRLMGGRGPALQFDYLK